MIRFTTYLTISGLYGPPDCVKNHIKINAYIWRRIVQSHHDTCHFGVHFLTTSFAIYHAHSSARLRRVTTEGPHTFLQIHQSLRLIIDAQIITFLTLVDF